MNSFQYVKDGIMKFYNQIKYILFSLLIFLIGYQPFYANNALLKTDGTINNALSELIVKLSEGGTNALSRISKSGFEDANGEHLLPRLAEDLTGNIGFKNLIVTHPSRLDAWEFVRNAVPKLDGSSTKFALDEGVLNKVSAMMQNNSPWRNALRNNWEADLATILNKNKSLKCITCSGGFATRPDMVEFLIDVEFYVSNYDINGVGNKFYRWVKRVNVNETTMLGGESLPVLEEMYQTL